MKKIICMAMMILAVAGMSAQNKTDKNGQKQGHWVKYYDNGKVMYEGDFQNNKPVGEFVRYYDNGKIKIKQNFDAKTGEVYTELYRETGKLMSKGVYKNEKKTGEWITYSQKGEVMQVDNYSTDGLLDGMTTTYDAQGRIFETMEWEKGKKNGYHKQFFPNGQVQSSVHYTKGLRDGECLTYFDDGKMETRGQYVKDRKDGIWTVYDRDGETVVSTTEYIAGSAKNKSELAKKEQEEVKLNDDNAGKMKDPADYQTSPEEFFSETEGLDQEPTKKSKKAKSKK